MKRDMDLVRLILLKIEETYHSTAIHNLSISGYDTEEIAYHCDIMHDAGLISSFNCEYASDEIYAFAVGSLTWDGNDYLDKIRDDSQWRKIKETIVQRGIPLIIDTVKTVANTLIASAVEGAMNSIMK